jgi:hypothetical protein
MLFLKLNSQGEVTEVSSDIRTCVRSDWQSRWDWKDFATVERLAASATKATGRLHIGFDNGPCVSPRYDVMEAPNVGDKVSYAFNGDSYPDGEIVHITPGTLRIIKTSTGNTYYRRKQSGSWKQTGGTWSLIQGHHNERNPHL